MNPDVVAGDRMGGDAGRDDGSDADRADHPRARAQFCGSTGTRRRPLPSRIWLGVDASPV
jgi:hypothetical protein